MNSKYPWAFTRDNISDEHAHYSRTSSGFHHGFRPKAMRNLGRAQGGGAARGGARGLYLTDTVLLLQACVEQLCPQRRGELLRE